MSDIAIKFENISKQYRLGLVSTQTLSHDLNRWWQTAILRKEDPYLKIGETNNRATKGDSDYVWALKNIDFEVNQGDVLGIIGKNGAGKSTLLKILSKVTGPTTGVIKAKGKIASLLEVGTGFHQELTGRENIYMNGSIMGMTKKEIDRKMEEIVDFAGVARYIDTPVKRYSSGMTVRLGFSIAAHLEPDILVVDEVLAVGDAEFQKKAIGKMQDVSRGEGRTVLFVSHNMGAVKNLCTKGCVLEDGCVAYRGGINSAVDFYLSRGKTDANSLYENMNPKRSDFIKIEVIDPIGNLKNSFSFNDIISINFGIQIEKQYVNTAYIGVPFIDQLERIIFIAQIPLNTLIKSAGKYEIRLTIPSSVLLPNSYTIRPALHIPNIEYISRINAPIQFTIEETGSDFFLFSKADNGCIRLNCDWNLI